MDRSTKRTSAALLTVTLVALLVGVLALVAASGTVAADQHEPENAPTYETSDGGVNFTINLPERTDHYPGDQNEANASIEYFAAGDAAFTEQDAEEGLWLDIIIVEASWIDYSECTTSGNTKEFGIDRGNNNSGAQSDESLLEHQSGSDLKAGGLTVYFYNWDAVSNGPPYLAPEDAVVASQGVGSNDGPCLTMTDEPGWYQIQSYTNGTIATKCTEENADRCEPDDKQWRGVNLNSNYVYVCECNSEQEAREKLGPPPSEGGSSGQEGGGGGEGTETPSDGDETATPDGGGGETSDSGTPTPTATPPPSTPTPESGGNGGDGGDGGNSGGQQNQQNNQQNNQQSNQQNNQQNQQNNQNNQQNNERTTPTISDGPGFTPVVALVALLAAALVAYRRS